MGAELYPPPPKPGDELKDAIEILKIARGALLRSQLILVCGVVLCAVGIGLIIQAVAVGAAP